MEFYCELASVDFNHVPVSVLWSREEYTHQCIKFAELWSRSIKNSDYHFAAVKKPFSVSIMCFMCTSMFSSILYTITKSPYEHLKACIICKQEF